MNRSFWRIVFLAGLLSAVTAAFLGWDGRYTVVTGDVLPNTSFENGFESWQGTPDNVALSNGVPRQVRIIANDGRRIPLVTQVVHDLDGISHLRVGMDIRTEDIVPGYEFWKRAGVFIYSVGRGNRRLWYWPYEIALIEGTSDWRRHAAIIPVSADAAYMQLFLFNGGEAGRMYARNVTVETVAEHGLARGLRWGLIGAWVVFGCTVLVVLLRRRRTVLSLVTCGGAIAIVLSLIWPQPNLEILQRTALQAANTAIIALRSSPVEMNGQRPAETADDKGPAGTETSGENDGGSDSETSSRRRAGHRTTGAMTTQEPLGPASFGLFGLEATTSAHLVVFAVLAVFARLAFRRSDPAYILVALTAFALASEVVQGFTITRTVELEDGVYNAFGAIVGFLMTSIVLTMIARLRSR